MITAFLRSLRSARPGPLVVFSLLLVPGPRGLGAAPLVTVTYREDRARVRVPVEAPGSTLFHLTLDTGMTFAGAYLFHREVMDRMRDAGWEEVRVPGAGADEPARAVAADSVALVCGGRAFGDQLLVVSIGERTQGFPTDGVIGATFFDSFVVEIDPDSFLFRLHDPADFEPPAGFAAFDIELRKKIPFLEAAVSVAGEDDALLPVYIDLASGDALELLVRDESPFPVPDDLDRVYLGTGLSGDIHGGVGRVARLRLGEFELREVTTAFAPAEVRSKQEGAGGILGNGVIRRFHAIFDYSRGRLYLRPASRFDEPFEGERP